MRKIMKKPTKKDEHPIRYVVMLETTRKRRAGILARRVTVDGHVAFIHPEGGGRFAEVVSAENVFDTREAAIAYAASKGSRRWVVDTDKDDVPHLFEAWVKYLYPPALGSPYNPGRYVAVPIGQKTAVQLTRHAMAFETKAEAVRCFETQRREARARIALELKEARAKLGAMNRRRTGKIVPLQYGRAWEAASS